MHAAHTHTQTQRHKIQDTHKFVWQNTAKMCTSEQRRKNYYYRCYLWAAMAKILSHRLKTEHWIKFFIIFPVYSLENSICFYISYKSILRMVEKNDFTVSHSSMNIFRILWCTNCQKRNTTYRHTQNKNCRTNRRWHSIPAKAN